MRTLAGSSTKGVAMYFLTDSGNCPFLVPAGLGVSLVPRDGQLDDTDVGSLEQCVLGNVKEMTRLTMSTQCWNARLALKKTC